MSCLYRQNVSNAEVRLTVAIEPDFEAKRCVIEHRLHVENKFGAAEQLLLFDSAGWL